jgi:hypothetical protein
MFGMEQDELRNTLLELFPKNETFVDEFLARVDSANEVATTRIARAKVVRNVVEEEVVAEETTVEEEEVVEEEVEAVEETTVEDEPISVELDETFVADLVGSEEFRSALSAIVTNAVNEVRAEFEQRFRSLTEVVETQQELLEDVPARTKRAVVSYRPTSMATQPEVVSGGNNVQRTYGEIANESISEIFD